MSTVPSPDWTIPQGWDDYTEEDHAVWKTLFERQSRLLPGRACDEFVAGMKNLPIGPEQIPDFRRLSDVLGERTGHGPADALGGAGDDDYPAIAGMSVEKFTKAMQEYQNGTRTKSTKMTKEAKKVSAAQIADLAAYYGSLRADVHDMSGHAE